MSAEISLAVLSRIAEIVRSLSPIQLEAWLRCGHRIADGMLAREAEALMWSELAAAEAAYMAQPRTDTPDPPRLPPIAELGMILAALAAEETELDRLSGKQRREGRQSLIFKQQEAIRDLIGTTPAKTLADCAVQLSLANLLAAGLEDGNEDQVARARTIERITISAIAVIVEAAGMTAAEYDLDQYVELLDARFGGAK